MNEEHLLSMLDPDVPASVEEISLAAAMAVMDCFDRKVQREFFWDVLTKAGQMFTSVKQAEIIAAVQSGKGETEPAPEMIQVVQQIRALRRSLYEKMTLVAQCPTDDDKIS